MVLSGLKGQALQILVNSYLVAMGLFIVYRGIVGVAHAQQEGRFRAIGFAGGVIEGIGGSWGPVGQHRAPGLGGQSAMPSARPISRNSSSVWWCSWR